MTREEFLPVFHGFCEMRGLPKTRVAVELWFRALEDLTITEMHDAITRFVRNNSDYPTPAGIRRFAGAKGLTDGERADMAWGVVLKAVRCEGAYRSVNFDDPAVNAAINAIGGWAHLCHTPTDEMRWRQQAFRRAYEACARTGCGDGRALKGIAGFRDPVRVSVGLPQHECHQGLLEDRNPKVVRIPDLRVP